MLMNFKTLRLHDYGLPPEIDPAVSSRQDLLCLSLYCLGFSRIRNFVFRFLRRPVFRILAFHDVSDDQTARFRAEVEVLKEKANVISLDDFFAGKMSWSKLNVAITFDDGYRSWHDNISPVLKELGLPATFFVSSGFVGQRKTEEAEFLRNNLKSSAQTTGCLSTGELRKLAEDGFAIGGHTRNHSNLTEIFDINNLRNEIQKDKKELERITGTKVDYFAYPFGLHQNAHIDIARILRESGYLGAVTIVPGFNTVDTNRFLLRRDLVDASLSLPVFKARFLGNKDPVKFIRRILR
jgi:peptidoglycan/xylan/chitin deacetylase (PgdA/CDA1 family)